MSMKILSLLMEEIDLIFILAYPAMWRRIFVLAIPVVLYFTASIYNLVFVNHIDLISGGEKFSFITALINSFWAILWWTYVGMFSGMYEYILTSRTLFVADDVLIFKPLIWKNASVILGIIFLGTFLALAWNNRRKVTRNRIFLLSLVIGMLFIYVGVIVAGRQQRVEFGELLRVNTYYQYIFWVFMTISGFFLIGQPKNSRIRRGLIILFVSVSVLSGALQGFTERI